MGGATAIFGTFNWFNELNHQQKFVLEVMSTAEIKLDQNSMPLNDLLTHIEQIGLQLSSDRQMIGRSSTETALFIYNTVASYVHASKDSIVINVKVPLVGEKISCERVYTLPFEEMQLQTNVNYLLIDDGAGKYKTLTKNEFETSCKGGVCQMEFMKKISDENECEFDAAMMGKNNTKCKWNEANDDDKWIKLEEYKWLVYSKLERNATVTCNDKKHEITLGKKNLITLNNCEAETVETTVYQFKTVSNFNTNSIWRTAEIPSAVLQINDGWVNEIAKYTKYVDFKNKNEFLLYALFVLMIGLVWHYYKINIEHRGNSSPEILST